MEMQHNIRDHARIEGFTVEIFATSSQYDLELYIRPDADLDGAFKAICAHTGETLRLNGWLFEIEFIEAQSEAA